MHQNGRKNQSIWQKKKNLSWTNNQTNWPVCPGSNEKKLLQPFTFIVKARKEKFMTSTSPDNGAASIAKIVPSRPQSTSAKKRFTTFCIVTFFVVMTTLLVILHFPIFTATCFVLIFICWFLSNYWCQNKAKPTQHCVVTQWANFRLSFFSIFETLWKLYKTLFETHSALPITIVLNAGSYLKRT